MTPEQTQKMMKEYEKQLETSKKKAVKVGIPSDVVAGEIYNGKTIQEIAAFAEFGTSESPRRSFIGDTVELKQDEIKRAIDKQFSLLFERGQSVNNGLDVVGAFASNKIKESFRTSGFGKWEKNAHYTIRAKGSSKPLIDTGTLRNSITWVVENDS